MLFPVADWQFWAVTGSAAAAVWVLVRPFLGAGERTGGGPCSHCGVAAGAPCQGSTPPRERLVTLGKGR